MTGGVHRLEEQEREEEQQAQATAAGDEEPAAKKRRIHEDLAKRARRLTIRLASMANRCYWLSATEVAVHLLTGSDCLQTHRSQRCFTRQLQRACKECKRHLNSEGAPEDAPTYSRSIEAVTVQLTGDASQLAVGAEDADAAEQAELD